MSIRRGRPQDAKYTYKSADTYFSVNVDPDLDEIRIRLPKPPPYFHIDGYNLPPEEQYFRRLEIPDKLKDMQRHALDQMKAMQKKNKNFIITGQKMINTFWEIFEEQRGYGYNELAEFIKEVHWHKIHGYWFFNNGKPTYITGDHFDYLNFWTFVDEKGKDGGFPEYRDVDRRRYLFRQYAERTTESVWMDADGKVHIKDWGIRLCFGTAEPKSRRCGITGQSIHKGMKTAMSGYGRYFTIISMEGDNAEKHYKKKLIPAFQDYPLWLTPVYGGHTGNSVVFDVHNNLAGQDVLMSVMDYTDSGGERKNDGDKIHFLLADEEGKTEQSSISERWSVNKQAMSLGGGSDIIGFSIHPTTVEEMDVGGLEYMKLCNQSKFFDRGENGQTSSGLFEMFVPAWDGLEGFVDRFGMSVVDTPTLDQIRLRPNSMFARYNKGSKAYLQEQLDALIEKGTPEALESYRSLRRKLPMRYSDCWIGSSGDVGFDMEIIDHRLAELRRKSMVRRGRLEWVSGFGSDVKFIDDVEGPFELSMILKPNEANQRMKVDDYDPVTGEWVQHWAPKHPYRFTASADPFKSGTSNEAKKMGTHTRQSDGGIAVLWEHDDRLDRSENMRDWESYRFVLTYRYRPPSLDDYREDVLKTCIYFGAMLYPERNVGDVDIWMVQMGFGGYLMYDLDPTTGKRSEKAGFASYEKQKQNLFLYTKDYIRYRGHKEEHESYLQECKGIQGMEQMNKYDLFTACGGCLMGSKQRWYSMKREAATRPDEGQIKSIMDFFLK